MYIRIIILLYSTTLPTYNYVFSRTNCYLANDFHLQSPALFRITAMSDQEREATAKHRVSVSQ